MSARLAFASAPYDCLSISSSPVRLVDESPRNLGLNQGQVEAINANLHKLVGNTAQIWAAGRPIYDVGDAVAGRHIAGTAVFSMSAQARNRKGCTRSGCRRGACAGKCLRATWFGTRAEKSDRPGAEIGPRRATYKARIANESN